MRINHNIAALNTYRQLTGNVGNTGKSLEKLSSGLRINKAGDDAAGLAISEKMRAQIRGLDQATRNASDGISLIQTAEGALTETHSILQRMRELAVQSATDTNTFEDRKEIQKEINNLVVEVDRISKETQFNKQNLLNGDYNKGGADTKYFHIGANNAQNLKIEIGDMSAKTLGKPSGDAAVEIFSAPNTVDATRTGLGKLYVVAPAAEGDLAGAGYGANLSGVLNRAAADGAITLIDSAINAVSSERAKLGGIQNRLEHTINNLGATSENLAASESRIRDVDMAKEMMEFTKNNILSQASQAMLAQANMQPQSVLQLLQ